MPFSNAQFFGSSAEETPVEATVATESMREAAEAEPVVAEPEPVVAEPESETPATAAPESAATPASANPNLPEAEIASEPMPGVDELAKSIVEAAAEAARARSRRHTVVYSARPLDDAEMEAVAAYVHEKLDGPTTDDWLDSPSATDVRIVVDGQVVEGTLDINDEPDLENVVDESLIMGIRIVRGDTVIDGSLRHRLNELKHSMHS